MTYPGEPRRLYKDPDNRMIAGVAAGIANYYGLDPTLVRIGFAVLGAFGGGLVLYVILWIIIPDPPPATLAARHDEPGYAEQEEAEEILAETGGAVRPEIYPEPSFESDPTIDDKPTGSTGEAAGESRSVPGVEEIPGTIVDDPAMGDAAVPGDLSSEDLLREAREDLAGPDPF